MPEAAPRTEPAPGNTLRSPRAAAIAGIVFSLLLSAILILLKFAVPARSLRSEDWSPTDVRLVRLALELAPFAGVAFLWFVGVVRDRLGQREDRFFSTVFFGSGILFLASFFVSAGIGGAVLIGIAESRTLAAQSEAISFGRIASGQIMNIFALKMAGVFMASTATLLIRTRLLPLWISIPGCLFALALLFSKHFVDWLALLFPLWVLALSVYILVENFKGSGASVDRSD